MSRDRFESILRNAIAGNGADEPQRQKVYEAMREMIARNAARSPQEQERWDRLSLDAEEAIAAVEAGYAPPRGNAAPASGRRAAFAAPDDSPRSASEYFWLKVTAACGALAGLLDFLKPVVNLQSPAFILSVLVAVAAVVLHRLYPARGRLLVTVRNAAAAMAVVVVGLFGLQAQFPGNAPNGAIAEALPGLVQLQAALESLRAPIEKMGQDVGRVAETAEQIRDRLDKMAESDDPVLAATAEIERAGYSLDADGLYMAIASGDLAAYSFDDAGYAPGSADISAMLTRAPADGEEFTEVFKFLRDYGPATGRRQVRNDMNGLFALVRESKSLNPVHEAVCVSASGDLASWVVARLKSDCDDLHAFYDRALDLFERDDRMKGFFDFTSPAIAKVSVDEYRAAIDSRTPSVGYLEGVIAFGGYSLNVGELGGERWANVSISNEVLSDLERACVVASAGGICAGRIYFATTDTGSSRFRGATELHAAAVDSPERFAAVVGADPKWHVGGATGRSRTSAFAGAYDASSATSALLVCSVGARAGLAPQLSVRLNTPPGKIVDHTREPDPPFVDGDHRLFMAFNGTGTGWPAPVRAQTGGVFAVDIHAEMARAMQQGRSMEIFLDGRQVGRTTLAGFSAAYGKLREMTGCGW